MIFAICHKLDEVEYAQKLQLTNLIFHG